MGCCCNRICLALRLQAHVETWAKEWELGAAEERALYLAAADAMRASKKKKAGPADGYRLTLKALASFEASMQFFGGPTGCNGALR